MVENISVGCEEAVREQLSCMYYEMFEILFNSGDLPVTKPAGQRGEALRHQNQSGALPA